MLTSGGSSDPPGYAFLPPSQHLALISTLIIHPSLTTRAKTPDQLQAANLALKYLRLVHKTIGPITAEFCKAFTFTAVATSTRRGVNTRRTTGEVDSPSNENADHVNSELANADGVWARADDFWQAIGWAFNCSVAHKNRWSRWQLWLDFIITVLENDWGQKGDDQKEDSLVIKYINAGNGANGGEKRILRAIFANGNTRSLAEFKEIWKNEIKERKPPNEDAAKATKRVTTKINIDENNYGDYLLSSSSELDDETLSLPKVLNASSSSSPSERTVSDGSLVFGGSSALSLRLRLLSLLSTVAAVLPGKFTTLPILYDLYLTHIRPLPLATFSLIISPAGLRTFQPAAASTLTQYILRSLISSTAPLPRKDDLTQEVLEECYLPWPANTMSIVDNAKVNLCVETLLRLLDTVVGIQKCESLTDAVERGIVAREEKAKKGGKKKGEADGGGESDRVWLKASSNRIRSVMEMADSS